MEPIRLGKYQLLKRIAAGGMAEIFVAKVTGIPGLEKIVVVKRILPQLATNTDFIQMFLDEARIAATLHHPNIVQMYDIGSVDGQYFISMEYLHGEDVRTLTRALRERREGLPLDTAIHIVTGLSAGLHYAHDKVGFDGKPLGIVHRDVTPQNIFITYDGTIKIVDFGIAKATNRLGETRYGTLKGKIPYMSPEQCRSEALDRRSDIYAIGIILFELTTGHRLYAGNSEFDIMKQIVEGTVVPPRMLRSRYPRDLEAIVMKALAKRKEDRYETAQHLQADLEDFARTHKLAVSSITVEQYMAKIFGEKVEAWREAQAAGTLAAHVAERSEVSQPSAPGAAGNQEEHDIEFDFGVEPSSTPSAAGELASSPKPRRGRRWPFAVLAAGTLAALGAVVWVKVTGGKAAPLPVQTPVRASDAAGGTVPAPPPIIADAHNVAQDLGILKVSSNPSGATVHVDGKKWADTTPTIIDGLTAGRHTVKVRVAGFEEAEKSVTIKPDETGTVGFELERSEPEETASAETPTPETNDEQASEPPPSGQEKEKVVRGGEGELRVGSAVSCEVIVNGKSKGFTPIQIKLPAGHYAVQCVNERFGIDEKRPVQVRGGQVAKERF